MVTGIIANAKIPSTEVMIMNKACLFTEDELEIWKGFCANDYKDFPLARISLLKKYPPFTIDLETLRLAINLENCFTTETTRNAAIALDEFQNKWDVTVKINKDFFIREHKHEIQIFPKFAAYQVIPSGKIEDDGYWMNNRAKDTMIFEVYLNAPLPLIIKIITDKIKEFAPEKEKPLIQLSKGDLPIWVLFISGTSYNDPNMIFTYKKYNDDSSGYATVVDRLRGKKGRLESLRNFVDPKGHGADWTPGECLESLHK